MSGLAALLAGRTAPGVYQWQNASDVDDVRHTVEHADWRFVHLDGWTIEDKASLLKAMAATFECPDHVGENFDALSDCLGDVTAGDRNGVVLVWDGWSPLARTDERSFSVALGVLAGRVHADRGGPFVVLLRGEGPSADVPELPIAGEG